MSIKWRPGSAGEKEAREQRIVRPILIIITLLLLGMMFVFPSDYRDAVKFTDTVLNVIGGVLVAGSIVPIIRAYTAGEEGATGYAKAWVVMLAAGLLIAAIQGL